MATVNVKVAFGEDGSVDFDATHDELDRMLGTLVAESEETNRKVRDAVYQVFSSNPQALRNLDAIIFGACRVMAVSDDELPIYKRAITKWLETNTDPEGTDTGKAFVSNRGRGKRNGGFRMRSVQSTESEATAQH